jgi:hypothetical protein
MAFKLNNSDNYESIQVWLSKENHPIAFENKVQCLINSGTSREAAEAFVEEMWARPIEMEVYYEPDYGLFLVEPDAAEAGTIYSPYSKELGEDADEES